MVPSAPRLSWPDKGNILSVWRVQQPQKMTQDNELTTWQNSLPGFASLLSIIVKIEPFWVYNVKRLLTYFVLSTKKTPILFSSVL